MDEINLKLDKIIDKLNTLETSVQILSDKIIKLEENTEKIDKETKNILEETGKMTDHLNVVNIVYDNVRKPISNITKMFLGKESQLNLPDRKSIEYKQY